MKRNILRAVNPDKCSLQNVDAYLRYAWKLSKPQFSIRHFDSCRGAFGHAGENSYARMFLVPGDPACSLEEEKFVVLPATNIVYTLNN